MDAKNKRLSKASMTGKGSGANLGLGSDGEEGGRPGAVMEPAIARTRPFWCGRTTAGAPPPPPSSPAPAARCPSTAARGARPPRAPAPAPPCSRRSPPANDKAGGTTAGCGTRTTWGRAGELKILLDELKIDQDANMTHGWYEKLRRRISNRDCLCSIERFRPSGEPGGYKSRERGQAKRIAIRYSIFNIWWRYLSYQPCDDCGWAVGPLAVASSTRRTAGSVLSVEVGARPLFLSPIKHRNRKIATVNTLLRRRGSGAL
eukprot:1192158-Prorocentrum_minimum.AAC.4